MNKKLDSRAREVVDENGIPLFEENDFVGLRKAGRLAAEVLDYITPYIDKGVTTEYIDKLCHDFIVDNGAIPAPLNYKGFPKSICTSINHVVCHGIPEERKLEDGDIMNVDVTVILDGWYGDTSRMFCVGKVSKKAELLVETTYQSMMEGINAVKPGATLGDIGHAIQTYAEARRFSVVRDFCGHGTGRIFHSAPSVMHAGNPGEGIELKKGMVFTIEPMINAGKYQTKILESDGWTAVTRDRSLSAQFEHTLAVTKNGFEIFTLSPKGYTKPPYV